MIVYLNTTCCIFIYTDEQTVNSIIMTKLGEILAKKSVNKSMVARKTGLSKARINELTMNDTAKLRLDEMYLIALATDSDPNEMMLKLCEDLRLKEPE